MPSLEELRAWLRGDRMEGLPTHSEPEPPPEQEHNRQKRESRVGVDMDKMEDSLKSKVRGGKDGRYKRIMTEGKWDAKLLFGKYRDSKVSEVAKVNSSYLTWMLSEGFDDKLKGIIRLYDVKEPKLSPRDKLMAVPIVRLRSLARKYGIRKHGATIEPEGAKKDQLADFLAMKMPRSEIEKYYRKFK